MKTRVAEKEERRGRKGSERKTGEETRRRLIPRGHCLSL